MTLHNITNILLQMLVQHAKKVVSDSQGVVDFATGLVISVPNLPDGASKNFWQIHITEKL